MVLGAPPCGCKMKDGFVIASGIGVKLDGSKPEAANKGWAMRASLVAVVMAAGLAGGCESLSSMNPFDRSERYKPEVTPDIPADKIYNEGLRRLQTGDNTGAAKRFADVDKLAPSSALGRKSLLLTAYAHFEASQWDDAISASRRFLASNPKGDDAAYAQYIMAVSYFNQIPDTNRDQERTERALLHMQELLERYPNSEYVNDVREKMLVARDQLAAKEMNTGRFYLEKRNYTGAINRFRDVVAKYQTTRHVEEALSRLTEAYMAMGIVNEAQTAAAVLGHNFPDSPWYKDAYALLQSGGLEPREDTGSWISRSFRGFTRTIGLTR
jgi:outer membrane protein assembly factor BamD